MDNGIDIVLENEELEVEAQEDFLKGEKGDKGETGYTPVKGVDYYTEKEKEELVNELTEDINQAKDDFNTNVATKTNEFNANVVSKTTEFNNNATNKMAEFNANTITKINEYNENAEDLINRVIEAEAENQRLKQDLNGLPSGQAEGETIDITDSAEMRFSKFNISGNSKQETREGYNLLNLENLTTITTQGVTVTNNKDGSFTLNGTSINSYGFTVPINNPKTLKANTDYTIRTTHSGSATSYSGSLIGLREEEGTNLITKNFTDGKTTYTPTEDVTINYTRIYFDGGVTFTNLTIYPMLYQGTEEREYEQYGVSPSPEYSSEVESCGDNIQLFDKDSEIKGAYYNSSNVLTTSTTWKYFEFIPKSNRDYTIKSTKYASEVYFAGFDSNGNSTLITNFSSNKVTFNSSNYVKIGYSVHKDDLDNIKLVEGTETGGYSTYGLGCISEVVCNKNLLDFGKDSYTNYGLTITLNKNNYTINGTSNTIGNWFKTKGNISGHIYLGRFKAGTYIASSKTKSGTYNTATWTSYFRNGNKESYGDFARGNKTQVIELTEDTDLYFQIYGQANTVFNNLSVDLQLEKSSNATEIIEPQSQTYTISTQQPMRSVGEIRDTFIKKNNKWFERHYGNRYIFTGNENWQLRDTSSNTTDNKIVLFSLTSPFEYKLDNNNKYAFSNNFNIIKKIDNIVNMYAKGVGMSFYYNNTNLTHFLYINTNQHLTVDDLKAWLAEQYNAGTPVYVDYVLAEPIDIECTEEQSEILWDIDQNAKTYDKVTHMYSTDEISPVIEVTYKKDIETLLNNLQAIAISNATEEV